MEIREQIKLVNVALSGTLDLYRYKICTQKQICDWWALPKQTVHGILLDFEKKDIFQLPRIQRIKESG